MKIPTVQIEKELNVTRIVDGETKVIKTDSIQSGDFINGKEINFDSLSLQFKPNVETGHSEIESNSIALHDKSNIELRFSTKNHDDVEKEKVVFEIWQSYYKLCLKEHTIKPEDLKVKIKDKESGKVEGGGGMV